MELRNITQFTRICELYPKTLFNGSIFNISFNQVQARIQSISMNNHIEQDSLDELRMLLVVIMRNKLDIKLDKNIYLCLKAIHETNNENNAILRDIVVLFAIINKTYIDDICLILKDIKETTSCTEQKLKMALALTDLILETHDKYNEEFIKFTMHLCTEILLQIEKKQLRSMMIAIIKKLVQFFNYSSFVIELWYHLETNTKLYDKQSISFDLMCAFSDTYLTPNSSSFECLLKEYSFWGFIQEGLSSPQAIIRKQSMYLLKRTIDIVSLHKNDVMCEASENVFCWKIDQNVILKDNWLKYFIMMDSLDEKQSHIIMPALALIDSLKNLQNSWLDILVVKIMNHDTENVKRFGILYALKHTVLDFKDDVIRSEEMLLHILNALNDTKIFPEENDARANVLPHLEQFLQNVQADIIKYILKINWAPVPLFYISFSFIDIENRFQYDCQDTRMIQKLIQACINSPTVYIRSAMQINIIKYYMKHSTSSLNVNDLPIVFGQFSTQESLGRGTKIWFSIVEWLQSLTFDKQEILLMLDKEYSTTKYNNRQLSRFLILCADANIITHTDIEIILKKIFSYFKNCENRLYTCNNVQCGIIDMTNTILLESKPFKNIEKDITRILIVDIISEYASSMMNYVKMKLVSCNTFEDIEIFDKCLIMLKHLFSEDILRNMMNNAALIECCLDNLLKQNNHAQVYFSVALLSCIIQYYCVTNEKNTKQGNKFELYIKKSYQSIVKIRDALILHMRNNKAIYGKVAASFHKHFCIILCEYVKLNDISKDLTDILTHIEDTLEYGGNDVVLNVLLVLKYLIQNLNNENLPLESIMNRCWNESLNLKKSDLFLPCIQSFINMLIQPHAFNNDYFSGMIEEYCYKLIELGKGIQGLVNMLLKKVFKLCNHGYDFTNIIIEGLLFGNISRRDQRIEDHAIRLIEKCGDVELINHDVEANVEIRALAVASLLKILQNGIVDINSKSLNVTAQNTLDKITNFLVQKCVTEDKNKTRYFSDSKHHRFKQRVLQTLLVLQPFWAYEQNLQVLCWANDSLVRDIHQPSVRYLLEWLVARIILCNTNFMDYLWKSMDKVTETRIGAMTSFICIIYLIAQRLIKEPNELRDEFIKKALSKITPWTMGQHFNLRLYAQVVTRKLLNKADTHNVELITFQESLSTILSYGNAVKFVKKVEDDIFLSNFDVIEHFSLENIFYNLPRLTKYTQEDIIHAKIFENLCNIDEFTSMNIVPLLNQASSLENAQISAWGINSHDIEGTSDELQTESDNKFYNVQQKITPWRAMDIHDATTDVMVKEIFNAGLIVVASLIDLCPNLGGLARTCEVFGVKEYVIDNLQRVKDKQFQSLSMSAEKWLRITEVKPWQLEHYLTDKQSEGYCIVGAEQTAKSHCITKTVFPEKCLLLLGNEKEGIPANLLPLLDMCIEIPQKGLIRSLNVHVTGALFVWEYARQYLVN